MVRTTCAVNNCSSSTHFDKHLRFHQFPQSQERCKVWIEKCGRPDLRGKSVTELQNKHLCNLHFEPQMYAKRNLKRTALPTLLLPANSKYTQTEKMESCTQSDQQDRFQHKETKTPKTNAQRQKEYRMRKKMEKQRLCPKNPPKTNAQHQQQYRDNQKKIQHVEEWIRARKKSNAERAKRYRDKVKLKKRHSELDSFLSTNEDFYPTQSSSSWDDESNPMASGQNDPSAQMTPIKLEIIHDNDYETIDELDAYDKYALSIAKKIKSIHSISDRIRLMNTVQDLVDNFCEKCFHDPIDSSALQTVYVPMVDGVMLTNQALVQSCSHVPRAVITCRGTPAMNKPVHVQQITIDPQPACSAFAAATTREKKTKKTPAKKRKMAELPVTKTVGDAFVEVPVDTTLPTEFVVHVKKKERQQRYREQNRERLKQREAERRRRKQHLPFTTEAHSSRNMNSIELYKEEISEAYSESVFSLEGSQTPSVRENKQVHIKKKERQQRYREQNRERLKQREAERRRRKQHLPFTTEARSSRNMNSIELYKEEISEAYSESVFSLEGSQTPSVRENKHSLSPRPDTSAADVGEPRPQIDILEIKEEQIQKDSSCGLTSESPSTSASSTAIPEANQPASPIVPSITFINDPIPIKLEIIEDMDSF